MKTYINGHCIEQVLTNAVELTSEQYNALSTEQKNHGTYIITDAEAPNISASNVSYDMGGGITSDVQTVLDGKVSKSGDTISGTFAPSSDRGANIGADNQRISYLWAYRVVGVTSIEKSANSGAYRQYLQDKTGNIALLEDMRDWVDITSLCTWGTGVTNYVANLNSNLKLIQFRGICPAGMANQGLLLTLPSGTTVKNAHFLGNVYDEVKNMHIDIVADNSHGTGIVKSSHSIGESTGIPYTFGGTFLIS